MAKTLIKLDQLEMAIQQFEGGPTSKRGHRLKMSQVDWEDLSLRDAHRYLCIVYERRTRNIVTEMAVSTEGIRVWPAEEEEKDQPVKVEREATWE